MEFAAIREKNYQTPGNTSINVLRKEDVKSRFLEPGPGKNSPAPQWYSDKTPGAFLPQGLLKARSKCVTLLPCHPGMLSMAAEALSTCPCIVKPAFIRQDLNSASQVGMVSGDIIIDCPSPSSAQVEKPNLNQTTVI